MRAVRLVRFVRVGGCASGRRRQSTCIRRAGGRGATMNPAVRVAAQSHSPFFQNWWTPIATATLNAAMLSRIESMA
eukprot:4208942-Pleurochrysis_carterae.AAC.2